MRAIPLRACLPHLDTNLEKPARLIRRRVPRLVGQVRLAIDCVCAKRCLHQQYDIMVVLIYFFRKALPTNLATKMNTRIIAPQDRIRPNELRFSRERTSSKIHLRRDSKIPQSQTRVFISNQTINTITAMTAPPLRISPNAFMRLSIS